MKNQVPAPANGHHYTAAEVVQILERARELGVTHLKIEGFEATWGLEPRPAPDPAPLAHQVGWQDRGPRPEPKSEGVRRAKLICSVCGSEKKQGKFGKPYCVSCYIAKKESQNG